MHKRPLFRRALPVAALALPLALLAACDNKPEVVSQSDNDPDAANVAAAAPVALPPMVEASRTYRCKDNSLVYIDFFNNKTAVYKTDKAAATGATLTAPEDGKPYVAEGYSVSANAAQITLTAPGKGTTSCKA